MRASILIGLWCGVTLALEATASAQVCHQPAPGLAQIETGGVAVTINVAAGSIPKVNGTSCGFAATAIEIVGAAGTDVVTLNYVPPSIPVTAWLGGGTNRINLYATNGNDTIACGAVGVDRDGDSTDDLVFAAGTVTQLAIYGRGGDDVVDCSAAGTKVALLGGPGNDTLIGGASADTLDGGTGADSLDGGGGNDRITGGADADAMTGGPGNDSFVANGGSDGMDVITGGPGIDTASYLARTTPVIAGGAGAEDAISDDTETIKGGKGDDVLDFSSALLAHNLYGNAGDDVITGGAGNDRLYGEAGADALSGNAGTDLLDAGAGDDALGPADDGNVEVVRCGDGTDTYVPNAADTFVACELVAAAEPERRIAAGAWNTCAILVGGQVKCWGWNLDGRLGLGDHLTRGDGPGEMGAALPFIDLGTGRTAVAITAGWYHFCALLDDASVKCWGLNSYGALGLGDTLARGDQPGEMGDALPTVDLGTGRTAKTIVAGADWTCAILDDDRVKCWGANFYGGLGLGDTLARGDQPGEMGDALPAVDLGTGRTATAIAGDYFHACALLDDGTVKCWGNSENGELGQGDTVRRGDGPGEMGDALPPIDLGTGRTALAISVGNMHTCAMLDDHAVKCWGYNADGILGLGDDEFRGDDPGEMGDALPAVDLGTGHTASAIAAAWSHTCARLEDLSVKCWGTNDQGQLGLGDSNNRGASPADMGDALPVSDLGTGRTVSELDGGGFHTCAVLDDGSVKCWGSNDSTIYSESDGALGLGDTESRGDQAGEMGDALPAVDLGGPLGFAPASGPAPEVAGGCSTTGGAAPLTAVGLALLLLARRRRPVPGAGAPGPGHRSLSRCRIWASG